MSAGGLNWHVQDMGSGPVLLLLHGTGASTHSFRHLAPLLARHARVIVPDLPGHAFSGSAPDPTLEGMGAALIALMRMLDVRPEMIVGHSAGAAIGAQMLRASGDGARLLVGLGSALLPFPGATGALFPTFARMMFANPFAPEMVAASTRYGGGMGGFLQSSTGSRIDVQGLKLYDRLFRHSGHVSGAMRMMAHWEQEALSRHLPLLGTPMLLIHGDRDAAVPVDVPLEVKALVPDTVVEIVPGLGHLIHEEDPRMIAERVLRAMAVAV